MLYLVLREEESEEERVEEKTPPPPSPPPNIGNSGNKKIGILGRFGPEGHPGPMAAKTRNSLKFTKIPKIPQNPIIFVKSWEVCILRENGHRFAPTLQNVVFPMVFYRYFGSFSPESRFCAKRWKFR